MLRLALFQPDIPQNLGAALRIGACLGAAVDVIEPCGFPLTDKSLKRAAMDYAGLAVVARWGDFGAFLAAPERAGGRLVLAETDGAFAHVDFPFQPGDTIILGRESAGSPPVLRAAAQACVRIPLQPGARSLNVAVAGAIVLAEALRQTGAFAPMEPP